MDTKGHTNKNTNPRDVMPSRGLVVFGRWALVVAGVVAIALGFVTSSALVRIVAFAGLAFLLANALFQHMPLSRACVAAAAIALLFGAAVSLYRLFTWDMGLASWLPDALGSLIGAALSYPVLKRINRIMYS